MKFAENNAVIMEDGTTYDAYAGCISLHPDGHICGGFNFAMHDASNTSMDGKPLPPEFEMPVHHRLEIAEHQIALWSHYAAQQRALQNKKPTKKRKGAK